MLLCQPNDLLSMRFLGESGVENSAFAFENSFLCLTCDLSIGLLRHIEAVESLIKWNSLRAVLPGDRFAYRVRVDHRHSETPPELSRQGRFAATGQAANNHKERFQRRPGKTQGITQITRRIAVGSGGTERLDLSTHQRAIALIIGQKRRQVGIMQQLEITRQKRPHHGSPAAYFQIHQEKANL